MTVLQEPVQAAIWQALNHYAYRDAVFLAERLYAEVHSEEALFLLATCYYRSGKAYKAYRLLKGHSCTTPQCKYLLAKCCVDLSKLAEGEQILSGGVFNKQKSHDDIVTEFGDSACFTLSLLGHVYCKTDRLAKGSECYQKSLSLNPFLWSPFESLCEIGTSILSKQVQNKPKTGRSLLGGPAALSPLTPSFGILPLETPSPGDGSYLQNYTNTSSVIDVPSTGAPSKKSVARIGQTGTKSVFSQSGNSREVTPILVAQTQSSGPQTSTTPQVLSPTITSPPNALPRRSSRLFTSDSSTTKENSKKLKMKFPPKIPNRKTKSKTNKGGITQPNINDSLEITKLDSAIISEGKISTITPQIQAFNLQKAAAEGLMSLLREMGKGYLALCSYNCKEAINILSHLPSHHYNTGWVLCQIGRAYFELSEYMQAERIFSEVRRIENYRVEGMEIYSTTLWHLQKDVALSVLSKDLTDMDKNSPEAWCAAGNCFSLQREHDIAIKFFQRAIQVDPNYAYAYTLLGHEFVLTEELDKALACFRNAIRVNPRHYNAWYGLGMIYYKQEKFSLAEMHFQKALDINPQSSVLLCHIGVVQHALKKSEKALDTLNKAIVIDPKNPLCKFHRASVLFANEKYKSALQELEELKQIVPKESLVYFLIGKVYKKLGQTHLALMNFSWAMDLDPKGANNQIKEAIDKRYLPDDEEPITQEEQIMGTDESQESSMTDADDTQLHAAESDEF
ncbi:cell division cycle protein 27 homolog isoform X4 [Lagenorhynchus albirostris]|uniref:cell division cycle protein 27 homolog isoform X4 n=1 Tax=Lagenorhynchus albirostris TaxID=27610 RepID=UPI0028E5A189|nr:cell division cycle protein 27 homolog isoform X4 [Lagenorhynchus albirostris]